MSPKKHKKRPRPAKRKARRTARRRKLGRKPRPKSKLELRLKKALGILNSGRAFKARLQLAPKAEIQAQLTLINAAQMTELNWRHRRKEGTTDVLSFLAPPAMRFIGFLGEVIICTPVLKAQARELGHSPDVERDVLMVHGLVHLLGWDHEKGPEEAKAQALLEKKILKKLNPRAKAGLIARALSFRK